MCVCGASIMGLLMLSASQNTHIKIRVEGDGATEVLEKLAGLVTRRFDEDC